MPFHLFLACGPIPLTMRGPILSNAWPNRLGPTMDWLEIDWCRHGSYRSPSSLLDPILLLFARIWPLIVAQLGPSTILPTLLLLLLGYGLPPQTIGLITYGC